MNIPAIMISSAVGAAFFAAEFRWYYQPEIINPNLAVDFFSTEHMKARAAVRHVLIDPDSAQFSSLRSVEADAARYVCGAAKARDAAGAFTEAAFVYSVSIDYARIDDDGRMTRDRSTFSPCPVVEDEKVAEQKLTISPGALAAIKTVQKVMPKSDPSVLTTLNSLAPSGGGPPSGANMQQQIAHFSGQTAAASSAMGISTGGQASSGNSEAATKPAPAAQAEASNAAPSDPADWRGDQPPAAWPAFPAGHPLAKTGKKRTPAEALVFAQQVEERWKRSEKSGNAKARPSSEDIREACRALLAIDPKDADYRKAWAVFVRLRKIAPDVVT